ncbi:uncharacterized protein LOC118445415 [Vespa mandarinia]|uniref:uncharacterized protein LOC118445415 n=1 Tax=Vespa mandarinia TaxID=7446 RepID=UPI00161F5FFE|nr:uncharacterized protein LOC118445415 [Vespa mandarinia]
MIGKNEEEDTNDNNLYRIKLIANKRKSLEDNTAQIQEKIKHCFAQLTDALRLRERQLLRQAEAVHTQQLSLLQSSLDFIPSLIVNLQKKEDLLEQIQHFGNIELSGTNCITVKDIEPYKVAEYEEANKDHVSFDKSIKFEKDVNAITKQIRNIDIDKLNISLDCANIFDDSRSFLNSSLNSSIENERHLQILESNNISEMCKDSKVLPLCSSLYIIKQDPNTCVKENGEHQFNNKCANDLQDITMPNQGANILMNGINEDINIRVQLNEKSLDKTDSFESNRSDDQHDISDRIKNMESIKNQDVLKPVREHPKQVQQWLQQILVETEIEPIVHEVGQFSELSEVQHYNKLQLET